MEHRWGHRREVNRQVRLEMPDGIRGWGRIGDVSISGAWITSGLPARLMACVRIGFTTADSRRKIMAWAEGVIVRIAGAGFGVEWCELVPPTLIGTLSRDGTIQGEPSTYLRPG